MSNVTWRDALSELVVTGVNRRYRHQPDIDAAVADLPAQWPRDMTGTHTVKTFGKKFIVAERSGELVILIRPGVMGDGETNTTDKDVITDNLETALDSGLTGFTILNYSISHEPETVNGVNYAAVVATITAREG